jgi:hypothetical protein
MTSDAAAARAEASPTERELAVARRLIRQTHFIDKPSMEFVAAVAALLHVSFDDRDRVFAVAVADTIGKMVTKKIRPSVNTVIRSWLPLIGKRAIGDGLSAAFEGLCQIIAFLMSRADLHLTPLSPASRRAARDRSGNAKATESSTRPALSTNTGKP